VESDLIFILSTDAHYSFGLTGVTLEEPALIDASVDKICALWKDTPRGDEFLNAAGGVEKPVKRDLATAWLGVKNAVNAPIVDVTPGRRGTLTFLGGRHTFIVLKGLGHKRIKVAVRKSRAAELGELLAQ